MDFEQHLKGASSSLQEVMIGSAVVRVTQVDEDNLPDLVVNHQELPPPAPEPVPEEDENVKSL